MSPDPLSLVIVFQGLLGSEPLPLPTVQICFKDLKAKYQGIPDGEKTAAHTAFLVHYDF